MKELSWGQEEGTVSYVILIILPMSEGILILISLFPTAILSHIYSICIYSLPIYIRIYLHSTLISIALPPYFELIRGVNYICILVAGSGVTQLLFTKKHNTFARIWPPHIEASWLAIVIGITSFHPFINY